jgi:O-antigen/teichoic acid export membrane protein
MSEHQKTDPHSPTERRISGTSVMVVGTVVAAIGAYALQFVGGRALGPEGFAPVSAIWTMMFIITSVVHLPLEQQVTRLAATGESRDAGRRVKGGAIALAVVAGVAFVAATRSSLFEGDWGYALQTAVLFSAVGIAAVRRGELAGGAAYHAYGMATVAQTVAMLTVGLVALALIGTAHGLIWGLALGPLANLFYRPPPRPPAAHLSGQDGDGGPRERDHGRFLGAYIGASVSSQGLLAAGPLAVAVIGGGAATISILFVTFTLFRAPLTLLYAMQARILPVLVKLHLAGASERLRSTVVRVAVTGAILAPVGFAAGWWLGPRIIGLLYGNAFAPASFEAAAIATGVVLATATHLAGQALVATGRTGLLAAAWLSGLSVATIALLIAPGTPSARVALAFLLGEGVALAVASAVGLGSDALSAPAASSPPSA